MLEAAPGNMMLGRHSSDPGLPIKPEYTPTEHLHQQHGRRNYAKVTSPIRTSAEKRGPSSCGECRCCAWNCSLCARMPTVQFRLPLNFGLCPGAMSRRIVVLPHGLISTRLRAFQAIWRAPLVRSLCITGSRSPGSSADRMQFGSTFLGESPQMLAQQGGIGQLERVAGSTRQEGNGRPRDLRTGRLYAAASSCRYGHGVHHQRPNQVATQLRSSTSVSLLPPRRDSPRLRQREQHHRAIRPHMAAPTCNVMILLANPEPSTQGPSPTSSQGHADDAVKSG
jgi:hypothetical protein